MHFTALCYSLCNPQWNPPKHLLRIMKLTSIILLASCLQVAASGRSQTVTLSMKNVPVQNVFQEIILQTGVSFVYDDDLFKHLKPVTIEVKDAQVIEVLNKCLAGQPVSYTYEGNSVVIKANPKPLALAGGTSPQKSP